jgi:hypothetical protein
MVPELFMVPELLMLSGIVTVTPAGITLSSEGFGIAPPTQVEGEFQFPPAGAAVTVTANTS